MNDSKGIRNTHLLNFASKLGFFGGLVILKYKDRLFFIRPDVYKRIEKRLEQPYYSHNRTLEHSSDIVVDYDGENILKNRFGPSFQKLEDIEFNTDQIYMIAGIRRS